MYNTGQPKVSPLNARRRRMLGGDVMAGLFGGSDRSEPDAYSPNGETKAVARQRKKMLGGSAMSAMLSGSPSTGQTHQRPRQPVSRPQHQQPRAPANPNASEQRDIEWGIRLIKEKCEGKGQSLSNLFIRSTEGDGNIDFNDYGVLLRKLNINIPRSVQIAIFRALDVDGNGSISLYEFLGRSHNSTRHVSNSPSYAYQSGAYDNPATPQPLSQRTGDVVSQADIEWAEKMLISKIEAKRKSLRKTFLAIDNDRNGYVSFREFQDLLRLLNANFVRIRSNPC